MPTTARLGLPYPDDDDPIAQGFSVIQQLATKVEASLMGDYRSVTDPPSVYPVGTTIIGLTGSQATSGGWPYGESSQILTVRAATDRAAQYWFRNSSGTSVILFRSGAGEAWTPWSYLTGPGLPNAMAAGVVSFNASGSRQTKTVTFPAGRFSEAPIVVVSGNNRTNFYTATAITKNGFSANIDETTLDTSLYYQAVQMGGVL